MCQELWGTGGYNQAQVRLGPASTEQDQGCGGQVQVLQRDCEDKGDVQPDTMCHSWLDSELKQNKDSTQLWGLLEN